MDIERNATDIALGMDNETLANALAMIRQAPHHRDREWRDAILGEAVSRLREER